MLAIHFDADVNPVTQDWLNNQLDRAQNEGYDAAVIVLDTPGGLSDSMRKIVQKELSPKIPVIVYVAPSGARAASAGVWISRGRRPARDGARDEHRLVDADQRQRRRTSAPTCAGRWSTTPPRRSASLAKSHGRNAEWADRAVRKASNLTATEALKMNVIDMIAPTLPALLEKSDGYKTTGPGRSFTLHLAGAQIVDESSPGFLTRFLSTLIDPNIVSLLFLAGLAGIGFEIFHPGVVLPGALGAVALVTALFGFSVLPLSWAGLALVLLGVGAARDRRARDDARRAHGRGADRARRSGSRLLFHNAPVAVPHLGPARGRGRRVALGGFWAFAIGEGGRRCAGSPVIGRPAADRRDAAASCARAGSSSSAASSGASARRRAARAGRARRGRRPRRADAERPPGVGCEAA